METEPLRKDSWSESDDIILAQTVLAHIKSGSTQLNAFDDVSERLGRTAAACGFRWNATVRKDYSKEIREAKVARLNNRNKTVKVSHFVDTNVNVPNSEISIDQVISFIKTLQHKIIERDNRIIELEQRLVELSKPQSANVIEDYQTFLKILETARNLGIVNN